MITLGRVTVTVVAALAAKYTQPADQQYLADHDLDLDVV